MTTNTPAPGDVPDHPLDFLQSLSLNSKLATVATIEEQAAIVRSMDAETLSLARVSDSLLDALRCLGRAHCARARGDHAQVARHWEGFRMYLRLADEQFNEGRALPAGD